MEALMDIVVCAPASPWRPPDWRWRTAAALLATASRPRWTRRDPWLARARRYRRRCGDDPTDPRFDRVDRDVAVACRLKSEPDGRAAAVLEGRLLAGQALGEIAGRCGLEVGGVEAYLSLFFDVGSRLHSRGYVVRVAIGLPASGAIRLGDDARFLKWVGYAGGPVALEAIIAATDPGGARAPDVPPTELERALRVARLALELQAVRVDGSAARRLARLERRRREVEALSWHPPGDPLVASFGAMVAGLPGTIAADTASDARRTNTGGPGESDGDGGAREIAAGAA